jgi:hypothetical protein
MALYNFKQFVKESSSDKITVSNIKEYSALIYASLKESDDELKKGLDFTLKNLVDYNSDDFVQELVDSFLVDLNASLTNNSLVLKKIEKDEDTGYSGNKFVGANYTNVKDMRVKDIAKLVRKELEVEYPEWSFSVRSDYNSIDIDVLKCAYNPFTKKTQDKILANDSKWHHVDNVHGKFVSIYTQEFSDELKKIRSIMNKFNYNDSNMMVDYFSVNFYGNVTPVENSLLIQLYPESELSKNILAKQEEYRAKEQMLKAERAANKALYKKGQNVIFSYSGDRQIPMGDYPAVVLKAPVDGNKFNGYLISFKVDQTTDPKTGEIVKLEDGKKKSFTVSTNQGKLKASE